MIEPTKDFLREWNKSTSERGKMQHAYLVLAVATLIAAGLIGLINYRLGQSVLFVAIVLALVWIANAVVWALLQSFVILRLPARKATPKKK